MHGAIARGPQIHRTVTYARPPVLLLRVRVPRSLRRGGSVGKRWITAAAAGEGARAVARGERRLSDVRHEQAGRGKRAPRPDAASPGGSKRGSVAGAVALIVGTSIGSGILAVPQRTAPAVSSVPTKPTNSSSCVRKLDGRAARYQGSKQETLRNSLRDPLPQPQSAPETNRAIDPGCRCYQDNDFPPIIAGAVSISNSFVVARLYPTPYSSNDSLVQEQCA